MRRMFGCVALVIGVLLVVAGSVEARGSCGTRLSPLAAQAGPPTFKVLACSTDAVELSKYDRFRHFFVKLGVDTVAFAGSWAVVEGNLGSGWDACMRSPSSGIPFGRAASAAIPNLREAVNDEQKDVNEMEGVADFARQRKHRLAIDAALLKLRGAFKLMSQVVDLQEAAANALIDKNCDLSGQQHKNAVGLLEAADSQYSEAYADLVKVLNDIYESSPCKDDVNPSAPLSDAQISRASGGGGAQRGGSTQDLSVVAPQRLKLTKRGLTTLPLTLKFSKPGAIEIWVTRAKRLLLNVHATAYKPVPIGLLLKLRTAHANGNLGLKISYTSAGTVRLTPTRTITLAIRPS